MAKSNNEMLIACIIASSIVNSRWVQGLLPRLNSVPVPASRLPAPWPGMIGHKLDWGKLAYSTLHNYRHATMMRMSAGAF